MAKDTKGRFKRSVDFAPSLPLENYWNKTRKTLPFAADSTDYAGAVVETGVSAQVVGDAEFDVTGRKWVLRAVTVQPRNKDDIPYLIAAAGLPVFQLALNTQLALLDGADDQVVCETKMSHAAVTNGGAALVFPLALDLLTPVPILAQALTCMQETAVNHTGYAGKDWLWKLYWGWADAEKSDLPAIVQQGLRVSP